MPGRTGRGEFVACCVRATILDETTRAIEAFREYLNVRVDPDPGVVQAEVDSVRSALETSKAKWSGRRN
jgi:hypothetical protein